MDLIFVFNGCTWKTHLFQSWVKEDLLKGVTSKMRTRGRMKLREVTEGFDEGAQPKQNKQHIKDPEETFTEDFWSCAQPS